jgi:hypothetical protein
VARGLGNRNAATSRFRIALIVVLAMTSLAGAAPTPSATNSPQGYIELCKETQSGLTGTFEFTYAGHTSRVTVANGSTQPVCAQGQQVPAGQVNVTEKPVPNTEVCGIRTIQPGRLAWTNGSTASVVVPAGGPETESTVVFCNRPAPKGAIQVCKETQGGLTGLFNFSVGGQGTSIRVSPGADQPACSRPIDVTAGRVSVSEVGVAGTTLCGIRTIPTGRSTPTGVTSASVAVNAGEQTTVVFCDRPVDLGSLQLCKVAGAGVAPGTSFTFAIRDTFTGAVTTVVVPAGECVPAGKFGDGTIVEVTETLPDGTQVTSRDVAPSDAFRPCGVARPDRLCAVVHGDALTTLTFTDAAITQKGTLQICKVAGTGIAPGMPFSFGVRDTSTTTTSTVVVPAGQCVVAGTFADGATVEVTEAASAATSVVARAVLPVERIKVCAPPQDNRVCASISGGTTTQVRFTNAVPQGQLKVCKVGGSGITQGAAFVFDLRDVSTDATSSVTVPAGQCALAGQFADGATVEVTEEVPVGTEVSDRTVAPIQWLETCQAPQSNRVCARISGGDVTHVTFTDEKPPNPRTDVMLCKVAGSPGVTGTYSFTVRTLPSGVPHTYTVPVGSCVTIPGLTVSMTLEITESVPAGQTATLAANPAEEARPCPVPAPGRLCVNVSSSGTRVTATNTSNAPATASLHLCKVAGLGVADGVPFAFTVRFVSSGQTTPATVSTGSCTTVPGIPGNTTVEVTEMLPAGWALAPLIAVDPPGAAIACATPTPTRVCASAAAGTTIEMRFTNRVPG